MAKKQKTQRVIPELQDSGYFLKLVIYMIIGSLWLKVSSGPQWQVPIPIGLVFGLLLISYEHHKLDRKIEYAILLVAAFVGFWTPIGIYISL